MTILDGAAVLIAVALTRSTFGTTAAEKREPRRSGAVSESYFFSSDGGNDVSVGAHCHTLTLPSLTSLQSLAAAAVEMISATAITNGFISTSPSANSPIAPAWFLAQPL